ncbi:MAG TPA: ATP-binding cassette domain-containing protein, partial [Candidatus Cybelea sp.]|nr:ATP-binding cassette domain-containing protein [Candidatus Cybelea sp.]
MPTPSAATAPMPGRGEIAIDMRGIGLTFAAADTPVVALSDVNLQIHAGEFVSLIGPSGCGKTTLLRVIADLERVTSGEISINGVSPEQARLERAYGYVF